MIKKSLLLLVYNGENYIDRALESVYKQNIRLDEIVVINDASSDNTLRILENWQNRLPLVIVNNTENIGIFASLNQGVNKCTGELIFRIDHDDVWMPTHVQEIIQLYKEDKEAKLYASRAIYLNEKGDFLKYSDILEDFNIRKKLLWDNPFVQSSTAFFKKDFLKIIQSKKMYSSEDYDLWIKLLRLGRLKFNSKITIYYYVYGNSLSRKNKNRNYRERFFCQITAINSFFRKYPFRSIFIFIIVFIRLALNLRFGRFN